MFNIKFIGVNEYATAKATLAELAVLDGYVTGDYKALNLNLRPEFEGDTVKFSDGSEKQYGTLDLLGTLIIYPKLYNDATTAVTVETFYPIITAIQKSYHYIYCQDYNIEFATEAKAINVIIEKLQTNEDADGQIKSIIIDYRLNGDV